MRPSRLAVPGGVLLLAPLLARAAEPAKLPLLFQDDFEKGTDHWEPTDPKAWNVVEGNKGQIYSQFRQSQYRPPHRSPHNIALRKDVIVGDFVLEAKVQSTARDYPHRDVCL